MFHSCKQIIISIQRSNQKLSSKLYGTFKMERSFGSDYFYNFNNKSLRKSNKFKIEKYIYEFVI